MKRFLAIAPGLVLFACTVRANVGALDPDAAQTPADASTSDVAPGDAQPDDASTTTDARDSGETGVDAGCGVTFPQEASFVDAAVTVGVPPSYAGGTIALGTYALVGMRFFSSANSGTMQVRETIVVRGAPAAGAIDRLNEARNATGTFEAYPLHGETVTWEAPNASFFLEAPECPQKDFQRTGQYEATPQTLTIFSDRDVVERKYQRIR